MINKPSELFDFFSDLFSLDADKVTDRADAFPGVFNKAENDIS